MQFQAMQFLWQILWQIKKSFSHLKQTRLYWILKVCNKKLLMHCGCFLLARHVFVIIIGAWKEGKVRLIDWFLFDEYILIASVLTWKKDSHNEVDYLRQEIALFHCLHLILWGLRFKNSIWSLSLVRLEVTVRRGATNDFVFIGTSLLSSLKRLRMWSSDGSILSFITSENIWNQELKS